MTERVGDIRRADGGLSYSAVGADPVVHGHGGTISLPWPEPDSVEVTFT